jgi:L-2-hydroxyglutarate oxidase LhgO
MLHPETPFPYVGSYALLEHEGQNQLVRIVFRREGEVVVGLPLKDGASGNLRVAPDALIDATPLTAEEAREFHDLDRALAGRSLRTPKQKAMVARRDALRRRMIHAPIVERLLREAGMRRAA